MENQIILACDNQGNFLEYIPKSAGHTGDGKHHLAITVFLYNSKGEILLQKRKHQVFDNIWDNTASTHQLHKDDGTNETDEEATKRALKEEYQIENIILENLGGFNYFARYDHLCENEFCKLLIGKYDGEVKLNPKVGYEYKWMDKQKFLKDIKENADKYTPWCNKAVKILEEKDFFK